MRIGTIHELEGRGYEILVDVDTRSVVLARFYDGRFIRIYSKPEKTGESQEEKTIGVA